MKLLVTGGAGYVGSVCAAHLLDAGHEVVVLDDLSTGHRDAVPAGAEFVEGELGARAGEILGRGGFDGVLHYAARSLVGESVEKPEKYWDGNVVASFWLLEALREMENSELVAEALGEEVFEYLLRNKRAEWDGYKGYVSPYEVERYLPLL